MDGEEAGAARRRAVVAGGEWDGCGCWVVMGSAGWQALTGEVRALRVDDGDRAEREADSLVEGALTRILGNVALRAPLPISERAHPHAPRIAVAAFLLLALVVLLSGVSLPGAILAIARMLR